MNYVKESIERVVALESMDGRYKVSVRGLKKDGVKSPAWFHGQGGSMKPHNGRAK